MQSTRPVFLSACLGMLLFGISLITLGSVAPGLQEKFHLDQLSSGALFSILPFGIIAGSFLFGPFADRYGYKLILLLSCLFMFAGFQGIAYAPSLGLLKVCVFLFGLGGGAINGATNAVVSDISKTNKSANLSLLGIFFAIGALGMPFILGVLEKEFSFEVIVSAVGYLPLIAAMLFTFTRFPVAKLAQGVSFSSILELMKDKLLLLIGFFLFCQCSFEAIINNWTTSYLMKKSLLSISESLYALSLYVTGMALMRLILGSALRKISSTVILMISFALLFTGCLLMQIGTSYFLLVAGLISLGAGLAAGFPVMLGFVGDRYAAVSGTAFSMVISIGLIGNISINYLMGFLAERYGIQHFTTIAFSLTGCMIVLSIGVLKNLKHKNL